MANLIEKVKGYFGSDFISRASAELGESESGISKALSGGIPAILAGVLQKTESADGQQSVLEKVREWGLLDLSSLTGGKVAEDAAAAGTEAGGSLLSRGGDLLRQLFGDKLDGVVQSVAGFAGIKPSSTSSLLSSAAPVALGQLGKELKERNLSGEGLSSFWANLKDEVSGALPSGLNLGSLLGLGGLGAIGSKIARSIGSGPDSGAATPDKPRPAPASPAPPHTEPPAERKKGKGWLWTLVLILLAILLIWFFIRQCGTSAPDGTGIPAGDTTDSGTEMPADMDTGANMNDTGAATGELDTITGNFIYDVGNQVSLELPDGGTLEVGENSSEARLYKMLSDESWTVDTANKTTGWITLDRIFFETGKSAVAAESENQLSNIALLLKAFPDAHLKLGGYTDNTGSEEANMKVSSERAKVVLDKLVSGGVNASRLESEGYGPQHPVCPANDTPACMAQNRRVDTRITKK